MEPSVCGKFLSWCRRRPRPVLLFVAAVVLLALLAVASRIGLPTKPGGNRRPPDSAASLLPDELTVDLIAAMSMDLPTDGSSKRFTKNCTMTSPTTGRTESIVLLPAAGLGSDAQPDGGGGGGGGEGGVPFARIIHRMWKTEHVPASWSDGASSCRLVNPDHSYCHWTDDELDAFIGTEYSWFLSTYRGYTYDIQRVDAARYFVLYHYGGTYLDLDLVCRRPLADLLNVVGGGSSALTTGGDTLTDEVVLVETLPVGVTNEFMAVRRARDPFMRDVVVGLRPNAELWYVFSYPTIMFSTGPMYLSNRLWQMQAALNQTAGGRNGDGSSGGHGNGTRVRIIERRLFLGEHFVHLVGSSWHRWDGIVIWAFFRLRYYLLAAGIVVALCAVYYLGRRLKVRDLSGSRRMSFTRCRF